MIKRRRWSPEEDQELVSIIAKRKFNLEAAFNDFHALHPERTLGAISIRWYGKLRLDNSTRTIVTHNKRNYLMMTINFLKRLLK